MDDTEVVPPTGSGRHGGTGSVRSTIFLRNFEFPGWGCVKRNNGNLYS
jgi:hypothetical protein